MSQGAGIHLQVDTGKLESSPEVLNQTSSDMAGSHRLFVKKQEETASGWSGTSGEAFLQAGLSLESMLDKVNAMFREEIGLIRRYAAALHAAEENAVGQGQIEERHGEGGAE